MIERRDERALARLHRDIRACTRCADAGYIERAFPVVARRASDRITIVGQAPGAVELTTGLPFFGWAGAQLRRWPARAGVDAEHLSYRTSITKYFPGKAGSGEGDRNPANRALLDGALLHPGREARHLTTQSAQVKSHRAGDAHRSSLRRSRSGNGTAALSPRRPRH